MKITKLWFANFAILALLIGSAVAQKQVFFEHLSVSDGLSSNSIRCIPEPSNNKGTKAQSYKEATK
jgi:hypothetical protein